MWFLLLLPLLHTVDFVNGLDCKDLFKNVEIVKIEWPSIKLCLMEISGENLEKSIYENIWLLMKNQFNGIENIPQEHYKSLDYALTGIPIEDLRNITFDCVEVVEAFGLIKNLKDINGFTNEQLELLAQKIRNEWIGKNPKTYSEYDLITMGEIICFLDVDDITQIHGDAFKEAVKKVGQIENCPQAQLEAFAKLAMQSNAFGAPSEWSKLDVSLIGNIINGLSAGELLAIDPDKMQINRYLKKHTMQHKP